MEYSPQIKSVLIIGASPSTHVAKHSTWWFAEVEERTDQWENHQFELAQTAHAECPRDVVGAGQFD
jgi:hypothetical protein